MSNKFFMQNKKAFIFALIFILSASSLFLAFIQNKSAQNANAATNVNQRVFHNYWWLRSPGDYCNSVICNAAVVDSGGTVYAIGDNVNYTGYAPRAALSLSLSLLPSSQKTSLGIGTCGSSGDTSPQCIVFQSGTNVWSFDIIGIRKDAEKRGLCDKTPSNSGYTDYAGNECPPNSVMLLLSNKSAKKMANHRYASQSSTGNRYDNSELRTEMNNLYNSIKNYTYYGTTSTLDQLKLTRNLQCGVGYTDYGTSQNRCSGYNVDNAVFYPLSTWEATQLYTGASPPPQITLKQPQGTLTFTQNSKSAGSAQYTLGGGNASGAGGNYTLSASGACSGSYTGASATPTTITFNSAGTCTLTGNRNTSDDYLAADQITLELNVRSLTQARQIATDSPPNFNGTAPNNTPTGTNPGVILALSATNLTLTGTSTYARAGYTYTQLCTTVLTGGTCSNAGITNYAMPDANTTLYPRWLGNSITMQYNVNNLPSGVAPAGNSCTYGTAFTASNFTSPQSGFSLQGLNLADSTWTDYIGNSSQAVDASLSSSTTTCFSTLSDIKELYSVWKDVTPPNQVAAPTLTIPNINTKNVRLSIPITTDIVTPQSALEYRVEAGSTLCNADVTTPLLAWTVKTSAFEVDYADFTLDTNFTITICARDIAGNASNPRVVTYQVHSITYDINDATSGIAPNTQYVFDAESVTTATFAGSRTNYTFSGWATSSTVNNTQTACPGTHYTAGGSITSLTSSLALYACWLDKANPVLTSLTAAKTSETNVRFTINAYDALAGTATTWKLGTTPGAADLCALQTLATPTCDTEDLIAGNEVVYYTITDLASNTLSGSQEFMSGAGSIAISLNSTAHGSSPITTDTDVSITATVTSTPSIAVKPHGQVTFTFTSPATAPGGSSDFTSTILATATCTLTEDATNYRSSCTLPFASAFLHSGVWNISAEYDASAGASPTGFEQLLSSGSTSITPAIQTTPTYVEFNPPTVIHTVSTNVSITGRVCKFDDTLGGPDEMELQTCAELPEGETIHFVLDEYTGAGYTTYTSPSLLMSDANNGTFTFTLPQMPLKGYYHLSVYYEGSSTFDTSWSQTTQTFEVKGSGITDGECSIPGYDNIIDCTNAGGTWAAGEFAYAVNNTSTTTARLDKSVTVTLKSPAKAISLVGDTADNGLITIQMYKRVGGSGVAVPNSTVTHKLTSGDCTNACDDSVQNEYAYTFTQPRYISEPGNYYYEVEYNGNQAIGEDDPLHLGYDASKAFDVNKASTALSIDSIADFAYSNDNPAPAGVLATANLTVPDYATYPPTGANASKYPTNVTNGALSYTISPAYDATEIRWTGVITTADTNCNPTAQDILDGWRGCTYLATADNPNTRKYKLFLGDYAQETDFVIKAHFGLDGADADVAFATSNATRTFQTFIPGFCVIGDAIHAEFTNPTDCQNGGGIWEGVDVKITYDIGAHGTFSDARYLNLPDDYYPNPTTLATTRYLESGGVNYGTETLWESPNVQAETTSGGAYSFAGWYKVPVPTSSDQPFATSLETLTSNITLYAVYVGPMIGRCSMPQFTTMEECEQNGGTWHDPGPYLVTDRTSVYAGETLNVSGRNFAPNEIVDIYLNSDPVLLTMAQNSAQGRFNNALVTIPEDTRPGRHTISALPNAAWVGAQLAVPADVGVEVIVRTNESFECPDPQWTNREDCREHAGGGTWSPCDEPTWSQVSGCDEEPPNLHTPYPLPDDFPSAPWVCVTDAVTGKTVCTNPEDESVPQWQCDPDGTCWYFPDDWPRNPGWICDADGICTQRPATYPEVVCDVVSNICWEIPLPPWGPQPGDPDWPGTPGTPGYPNVPPGGGGGGNGGGSYCNLPGYTTQESCEDGGGDWVDRPGSCSIELGNGLDNDQTNCEDNGGQWNEPGSCSDPQYTNQSDCENGGGTWYPEPGHCTDPQWTNGRDCVDNGGEWIVDPPSGGSGGGNGGAPDPWFPLDPDNQPHDAVLPPNPPWACTMKPPPNESEPASCRYPITGGDYDNPGDDTDGDGIGDSGYWECDLDEASSGYLKCTWEPENANPTPDNPNWTCNIDPSSGVFLDCEPYPNPDGWVCNVYGNCHPSWGYKPFADAVITLSKTTALHDEEFSVTGHGFAPNQPLEILMHSEPQTLGIALSDDTGSFTLPANVPAAELLDVGTHTVTAEDLRDAPAVVRSVPLERGPQLQVVGDCASKSWYAKTQSCIPPKLQVAPTGLNVTWGIIFLTLLTLGALGALRARRMHG